jgi:hypothetical protein
VGTLLQLVEDLSDAALVDRAASGHAGGVDERNAKLDRRISERVEHLNATRAWPWQQPGVESVALSDDGRVTRYLATEHGDVVLGPDRPAEGSSAV